MTINRFGSSSSKSSSNSETNGVSKSYVHQTFLEANIEEDIDMKSSYKVKNLPEPIDAGDAVSKSYLTNQLTGLDPWKNLPEEDVHFNDKQLLNTSQIELNHAPYEINHAVRFGDIDIGSIVRNNQNNNMLNNSLFNLKSIKLTETPTETNEVVRLFDLNEAINNLNTSNIVRTGQDNDMGNKMITGVNMMYVARDPKESVDGSLAPWGVTRKAYVDSHQRIVFKDKSSTFEDDVSLLNLKSISVLNEPTIDSHVCRKSYVDRKVSETNPIITISERKPLITLWAEESASLNNNSAEWSWGNGGAGSDYGYPMMYDGRILRASASFTPNNNSATISIRKNGNEEVGQFTKVLNQSTTITNFDTPLELEQGDYITFITLSVSGTTTRGVVGLVIELDV